MANKNFSAKSASVIGKDAKKEFSTFGECVRMVRRIFDAYEIDAESLPTDTAVAVADCLTAGVNPKTDLNIQFIVKHLTDTDWVVDGQIVEHKKGENIPVTKWTPNRLMDYVRKANRQQLIKLGVK